MSPSQGRIRAHEFSSRPAAGEGETEEGARCRDARVADALPRMIPRFAIYSAVYRACARARKVRGLKDGRVPCTSVTMPLI